MIGRRAFLSLPLFLRDSRGPLEYLSLDLLTKQWGMHWNEPERAVSMGSLLKPFLVVAYARTHEGFPVVTCRGTIDRCWLPRGHGHQKIVSALANSCNCYFLTLTAGINRGALRATCLAYGLDATESDETADRLIGLNSGWPQKPAAVVQAFAKLSMSGSEPGVASALEGMRQSALNGTARGIGIAAYAKTGTALCSHVPKAEGDGFVVAVFPADRPRIVLLARQHGTTGANTAVSARPVLRSLI